MMRKTIDLNVDVAEGFERDIELLAYATSVNIACGWHAGDALTMRQVASEALWRGIAIGAHPGYPDRANFGRMSMAMSAEEVYAGVQYQIGALAAIVTGLGGQLTHVKPHGALYNDAERAPALANAIVRAVQDFDPTLVVFGLAGGRLIDVARSKGLTVFEEGFADRAYGADGKLLPRSEPGAVIEDIDVVCQQALDMVLAGQVLMIDGERADVHVQTLCLHGDGAHAVEFARALMSAFVDADVQVLAPCVGR